MYENIYESLAVYLKLTEYYKSPILQLNKKVKGIYCFLLQRESSKSLFRVI